MPRAAAELLGDRDKAHFLHEGCEIPGVFRWWQEILDDDLGSADFLVLR